MEIWNMVVARTRDGRRVKGFTWDFAPTCDSFHVAHAGEEDSVTELSMEDLKAVFFVKTFEGIPGRPSPRIHDHESLEPLPGIKLKVTFKDGEVLFGTTNGFTSGREGFFVLPADRTSNNTRVYVMTDATQSVDSWR